ncbi:unnamed protein product [Rhodiola kirilowii]
MSEQSILRLTATLFDLMSFLGFVSPLHVGTTEQPTDIFTKSLPQDQLQHLCSKLGVSNFLHATA